MNSPPFIKYIFCLFILTTTAASHGMNYTNDSTYKRSVKNSFFDAENDWDNNDINKNVPWTWYIKETQKDSPSSEGIFYMAINPSESTLTIKQTGKKPRITRIPYEVNNAVFMEKKEEKEYEKILKIFNNSSSREEKYNDVLSYIYNQKHSKTWSN